MCQSAHTTKGLSNKIPFNHILTLINSLNAMVIHFSAMQYSTSYLSSLYLIKFFYIMFQTAEQTSHSALRAMTVNLIEFHLVTG